MDIQWVSIFSSVMLFIHFLFVLTGLFVLKKILSIIAISFKEKTGTNIYYPMYILIAYSLVSSFFWQMVRLKVITFSANDFELYLQLAMSLIQIILIFLLLFKILKNISKTRIAKNG